MASSLALFSIVFLFLVNRVRCQYLFVKTDGMIPLYIYEYQGYNIRCMSHEQPGSPFHSEQTCVNVTERHTLVHDYTRFLLSGVYHFESFKDIKKILMIGLGGGVLVNPLQELCPYAIIDVVEINPDMVDIARDFFYLKKKSNTHIHIEDGYEFIMDPDTQNYDLIIIDAFLRNLTPVSFRSKQFLKALKLSLSKIGVAVSNVLPESYNEHVETDKTLWKLAFNSYYWFSPGNLIFTGKADGKFEQESELVKRFHSNDLRKYGITPEYMTSHLQFMP